MICVEDREREGGMGWMYWLILLSHRGYVESSVESLRLLDLLFWSELVGLPIQLLLDISIIHNIIPGCAGLERDTR